MIEYAPPCPLSLPAARPMRIDFAEIVRTGIQDVDDQHAQLVDLYNRLLDWTERGHALAATFDALTALEAYIGRHFSFEEDLLLRIDFPGRDEHRARHAELAEELRRYSLAIFNGEDLTDQLMQFVSDWIKTHIAIEDMEFARYLSEQNKVRPASPA